MTTPTDQGQAPQVIPGQAPTAPAPTAQVGAPAPPPPAPPAAPPAPAPAGGEPQAGTNGSQPGAGIATLEDALGALTATRGEAAGYRTKLRETEAELQALRDAQLTEAQRVEQERDRYKAEAAAATAALQQQQVRGAITAAAMAAGAIDPEAVQVFLADVIQPDANGQVPDVAAAVAALLEAKPYLKGQQAPVVPAIPGGAGQPAAGTTPQSAAPTFTRAQLRDPAFYAANRDAIALAISEGRISA